MPQVNYSSWTFLTLKFFYFFFLLFSFYYYSFFVMSFSFKNSFNSNNYFFKNLI